MWHGREALWAQYCDSGTVRVHTENLGQIPNRRDFSFCTRTTPPRVASEQSKERHHCSCVWTKQRTASLQLHAALKLNPGNKLQHNRSKHRFCRCCPRRRCFKYQRAIFKIKTLLHLLREKDVSFCFSIFSHSPPLQDRIWMRVWGGVQWHLQWYVLHPGKKMDMLPPSRCTSWENRWRRFRTVWEINVALRATIFSPGDYILISAFSQREILAVFFLNGLLQKHFLLFIFFICPCLILFNSNEQERNFCLLDPGSCIIWVLSASRMFINYVEYGQSSFANCTVVFRWRLLNAH